MDKNCFAAVAHHRQNCLTCHLARLCLTEHFSATSRAKTVCGLQIYGEGLAFTVAHAMGERLSRHMSPSDSCQKGSLSRCMIWTSIHHPGYGTTTLSLSFLIGIKILKVKLDKMCEMIGAQFSVNDPIQTDPLQLLENEQWVIVSRKRPIVYSQS